MFKSLGKCTGSLLEGFVESSSEKAKLMIFKQIAGFLEKKLQPSAFAGLAT